MTKKQTKKQSKPAAKKHVARKPRAKRVTQERAGKAIAKVSLKRKPAKLAPQFLDTKEADAIAALTKIFTEDTTFEDHEIVSAIADKDGKGVWVTARILVTDSDVTTINRAYDDDDEKEKPKKKDDDDDDDDWDEDPRGPFGVGSEEDDDDDDDEPMVVSDEDDDDDDDDL
jgi:hypothetical protein